jgi:hypothetical protein
MRPGIHFCITQLRTHNNTTAAVAAAAAACADVTAAENFMVFQYAWMADPLYFGDYPAVSDADSACWT